jgi:hypothetical protein
MFARPRPAFSLLLAILGSTVAFLPAGADPARARQVQAALMRDTLAWVGSRSVTALDLVQRIEWMPWPGKRGASTMDSAKVRALHSLAGEMLLAEEAEREGIALSPGFARTRFALRRALARDALYQDVTAGVLPPPAAEVDRITRRLNPRARPTDLPALRRAVADSLRQMGARARAEDFAGRLLAPQRVTVDTATFVLLADTLRALMLAAPGRPAAGPFPIPGNVPDALLSRLRRDLDRRLAALPDGPLSLGDALEDFRLYPFVFHSLAPGPFAAELSARLKTLVEGELMAREALQRRLDERPEVQHDLRLWSDAWSAEQMLPRLARGSAEPATEVTRQIVQLAERRQPRFDYAALRRVDISPANMVTKRLLGFGGGMVAAPALLPLWDWVDLWHAERRPLP